MRAAIIAAAIMIAAVTSQAQEYSDNAIAAAIFKQEDSIKYPYGIKSIDTRGDAAYAKKICLNTIRHNRAKWIAAGSPGDFIAFMARTYTTTQRREWIHNVNFFLQKGGK